MHFLFVCFSFFRMLDYDCSLLSNKAMRLTYIKVGGNGNRLPKCEKDGNMQVENKSSALSSL